MGLFLYNIFLIAYSTGINIAALWNNKAKKWKSGRSHFPEFAGTDEKTIWMHCASLGEFEQGRPLIEGLRSDPRFENLSYRIVVSFFSPSGYEVMKNYALADQVIYLPMDSSGNARRLITEMKPTFVLWVKYEFWHYYLKELQLQNIPVFLVSGIFRSSQPFFKWYGGLWKNMISRFNLLFLQNIESAELLNKSSVAVEKIVSGDTRFDRVIAIAGQQSELDLIENFCGSYPVIVAGSTWEEDEAEWVHFVKKNPQIRFIIAPHEIDEENLKDVQHSFPGSVFYSQFESKNETEVNVLIIDNIGMLSRLYKFATISYVGGGFGDDGVHNVLEAAVYGVPVIHGPEYEKYAEAIALNDAGGSIIINSAVELEKQVNDLLINRQLLEKFGTAAKKYVYENAGATAKIVDYIYEKRLLTN